MRATQSDINIEYREAPRATAGERTERIISKLVVGGADVTEEDAERIYQRELKRVSRKSCTCATTRFSCTSAC